MVVECINHLS